MEPITPDFFDANRQSWNKRTQIHRGSDFYNVEAFKNGTSALMDIEQREVGNVAGKSLLHLQCHFGLDTLSWAREGATVTGVDFSDEAIDTARMLAAETNLPATFVCCNVYDLPQHLQGQFDIVFTSYGVIGWLPNLTRWASVIRHFLKPGGLFYMAEFHPVVWMFDNDFEKIAYPYHNRQVIEEVITGTYADRDAPITSTEYTWNHSLGEVVNALTGHGLHINFLNEYPYSPYNCFNKTVKGADGNYRIAGLEDKIPMVYSISATLPA